MWLVGEDFLSLGSTLFLSLSLSLSPLFLSLSLTLSPLPLSLSLFLSPLPLSWGFGGGGLLWAYRHLSPNRHLPYFEKLRQDAVSAAIAGAVFPFPCSARTMADRLRSLRCRSTAVLMTCMRYE